MVIGVATVGMWRYKKLITIRVLLLKPHNNKAANDYTGTTVGVIEVVGRAK
jgi:hypothetical protein